MFRYTGCDNYTIICYLVPALIVRVVIGDLHYVSVPILTLTVPAPGKDNT